ncbi:Protein CBG07902 [Caenorhabditis briggsae]|uniref:Protein CBG07902 n=1 Tax=Caenorhabditis briggsae TaxID=6238 RepID=A8X5D2_CAEBR|nr:Protein CBG07902 [Caenorhabditis briggsae]CAP27831.2 Protein CBG07902 [Caenorhabditis briggsae]
MAPRRNKPIIKLEGFAMRFKKMKKGGKELWYCVERERRAKCDAVYSYDPATNTFTVEKDHVRHDEDSVRSDVRISLENLMEAFIAIKKYTSKNTMKALRDEVFSRPPGGFVVSKKLVPDGDAQMDESVTGAVISQGPSSSTVADQAPNNETAGSSCRSKLEQSESSVPPPDETNDSTINMTSISAENVPGASGTIRESPLLHKILTDPSPKVQCNGVQGQAQHSALPAVPPADVTSSPGPAGSSEPADLAPPPAPSDVKHTSSALIDERVIKIPIKVRAFSDHPLDRDAANALIELSDQKEIVSTSELTTNCTDFLNF